MDGCGNQEGGRMNKLKDKLRVRLRNCSGETLAEVLIALLIAALALTMLASMLYTSTNLITQNKKLMDEYYRVNDELASRDADEETGVEGLDVATLSLSIKTVVDEDSEEATSYLLTPGKKSNQVKCYINNTVTTDSVIAYTITETAEETP